MREHSGDGQCIGSAEFDRLTTVQMLLDLVFDVAWIHGQPERFAGSGTAESLDQHRRKQGAPKTGDALDDPGVFPEDLVLQHRADEIRREKNVGTVGEKYEIGFETQIVVEVFEQKSFPARVMPENDRRKAGQRRASRQKIGTAPTVLLRPLPFEGFGEGAVLLGTRDAAVMQHPGVEHSFAARLWPVHFIGNRHRHQRHALAVVIFVGTDKIEGVGQ